LQQFFQVQLEGFVMRREFFVMKNFCGVVEMF
jgi:hypothetical protein